MTIPIIEHVDDQALTWIPITTQPPEHTFLWFQCNSGTVVIGFRDGNELVYDPDRPVGEDDFPIYWAEIEYPYGPAAQWRNNDGTA